MPRRAAVVMTRPAMRRPSARLVPRCAARGGSTRRANGQRKAPEKSAREEREYRKAREKRAGENGHRKRTCQTQKSGAARCRPPPRRRVRRRGRYVSPFDPQQEIGIATGDAKKRHDD